mgnify:CR=1 FL=1
MEARDKGLLLRVPDLGPSVRESPVASPHVADELCLHVDLQSFDPALVAEA